MQEEHPASQCAAHVADRCWQLSVPHIPITSPGCIQANLDIWGLCEAEERREREKAGREDRSEPSKECKRYEPVHTLAQAKLYEPVLLRHTTWSVTTSKHTVAHATGCRYCSDGHPKSGNTTEAFQVPTLSLMCLWLPFLLCPLHLLETLQSHAVMCFLLPNTLMP